MSHQMELKLERENEEQGRNELGEGGMDHVGHCTATGMRETLSGIIAGMSITTVTITEEQEHPGRVIIEETGRACIREPRAS